MPFNKLCYKFICNQCYVPEKQKTKNNNISCQRLGCNKDQNLEELL